jgi:NarL family two-component system response regulator LiaR
LSVNLAESQTQCLSAYPQSVLIVDDHDFVRAGLRLFFEQRTELHVCGEACNGAEGVKIAKECKPDLVLMDLRMPEMNGAEAAAAIRKELPDTRIVVFTLFTDAFGRFMAKATGVDVVVSKSEGLTGLEKALEKLLERPLS